MGNGEWPWWDRIWAGGTGSLIDLDTLSKSVASGIVDTTQADWIAKAEAARSIIVNDNVYFRPASITATTTAWNADTANNHNWIYVTDWMNDMTKTMFSNHAGFKNVGNQNVDLGFGTGIAAMLGETGVTVPAANGIGMIPWLKEFRAAGVATHVWGYQMAMPDYASGNWKPTWPLPEQTSNDLKYSSALKANDGMVFGDPFWSTGKPTAVESQPVSVPHAFSLTEAYPNPFNPSTHVQYTLAKAGLVSLKVYNVLGQAVQTVVNNEYKEVGTYTVTLDMSHASSGVYFYLLEQGSNRIMHKMVLMK